MLISDDRSKVFSYRPFLISFIASSVLLLVFICMLILSVNYCNNNCYYNIMRAFPCVNNGNLFCCSSSQ